MIWFNTGTTKLKALRPYMNEARRNEVVAGAFFMAASQMGNQLEEAPAPFIALICQVLPFVLGTDQEDLGDPFSENQYPGTNQD